MHAGHPHLFLDSSHLAPPTLLQVTELGTRGIRSLAVAKTDETGRWCMLGILTFLDPPRPDTRDTIERSMAAGVDVKMITGDHKVHSCL